jgi:hypothetical protein
MRLKNLLVEKNVPTNPSKWDKWVGKAKEKFDVYPSAYANAWAAKMYKDDGGGWKNEGVEKVAVALPQTKELKGKPIGERFLEYLNDNGLRHAAYQTENGDVKVVGLNKEQVKEVLGKLVNEWNSKVKEAVNEATSKEAMGIASFTGTRADAVQKFIDTHKINGDKLFNFIKKGKLSDRTDFVKALAGNPNNPIQNKMIKMFGESVNEATFTKGVTYGGSKCNGGCYQGKSGLDKIIKISKDNPNNIFMFRDDNYSGIQPHFIKNGVIAKATTLNPSYDLEKNKLRNLKVGNDVIFSVRLHESLTEGNWAKIMKGVKTGSQAGPWTIVVVNKNTKKVVYQKDVKIKDAIPAHYEEAREKFRGPAFAIVIEDNGGQIVYKESLKKEGFGAVGTGVSLPDGSINGAPKSKDVAKMRAQLNKEK